MHLNLHLTHACNLRCTYCYTGAKDARHMTEEVARGAIDFAVEHSHAAMHFTFFGGEPLLQLPLMEWAVEYAKFRAREKRRYVHFEVSTNGTLVDEAFLQWVWRNNIIVSLSLDGTQQAHDAHRVYANGQGSFAQVSEKLEGLRRATPLLMTLSVVSPDTVAYLADSVRFLRQSGVRVILLALDYTARWPAEGFRQLRSQLQKVSQLYLEATRAGQPFFLSCFNNKIRSHVQPGCGRPCEAAAASLSVAPSGNLYPCVQFVGEDQDPGRRVGNLFSGIDERRRSELITEVAEGDARCRGCALDGRCNNHCACLNLRTTGRPSQVSPLLCEYERLVTPIADRLAEQLYRERNPHFLRQHYQNASKEKTQEASHV